MKDWSGAAAVSRRQFQALEPRIGMLVMALKHKMAPRRWQHQLNWVTRWGLWSFTQLIMFIERLPEVSVVG